MLINELNCDYAALNGKEVCVQGWVRKSRFSKNVGFLEINDGSCFRPMQAVISSDLDAYEAASHLRLSSSVEVCGTVALTPQAKQPYELQVKQIKVLCQAAEDYPLQNKRQSFEFLRTMPHLRGRTNTFQSVFRVRSEIAFAIHEFLHNKGFVYVHTPIITASDAEGAGEQFQATTLDLQSVPKKDDGTVDYRADFFGVPANLTVSGQLEVEAFAMTHRNVYTFGPTFRAEHSNTTRHAAEFWMVEPEIAFADLNDLCCLAENLVRAILNRVLDYLPDEMDFFNRFVDKGLLERLEKVRNAKFARMTYTEAVEILEKAPVSFEYPVYWGCDLQSEHERYLTEKVVNGPLFVTNYPKEIKAFYMRQDDDPRTVGATDLLVPGIGELIGGSEREERSELLAQKMREKGLSPEAYQWYLDLNRFGGCRHAGFGLGFERMVMFLTGMTNIRDVLPYPRTVGSMR
uniref:asparagine--tRNA ligase n=1 Tax=Ndongobacter massiliensis TaxID=1871025 RepID=UPI0009313782|nr:asparagine--tRNA ligase [Ndongobacter massiliensis]